MKTTNFPLAEQFSNRTLSSRGGGLLEAHEFADTDGLVRIVQFMQHAVRNKDLPFAEIFYDRDIRKTVGERHQPVFNALRVCVGRDLNSIRERFKRHKLHPYARLFFDGISECGVPRLFDGDPELANAWFTCVRMHALKIEKDVINHRRMVRGKVQSMEELVASLRTRDVSMTVVRLDLGFGYRLRGLYEDCANSLPKLKRTFKALLNMLAKWQFLKSYAWRLDWRERCGFHYQLLLFCGDDIRTGESIGNCVGHQWFELTKNQGYYLNYNGDAALYRELGLTEIGVIDTPARWAGLEEGVRAWVEIDLIHKLDVAGRTFDHGAATGKKHGGELTFHAPESIFLAPDVGDATS